MKLMETLFFPTQVWYNYVQRTPGKAHVFYGMNTGNIRVFTRMRKTSKRKGKCKMKKIALICLCTMTALSLLTGCSNSTGSGNENLGSVELGEYKGVKVNMPSVIVTDAEVESRINQVLSQNPSEEELDRPAQEGDVVNIDYVGKQEGVEFAGGTDTGYDLTLGSGRFIEGLSLIHI